MKNILMIGTGGTIASEMTPEGLTPELNSKQLLSFVPKIGEMCRVDCIQVYSLDSTNLEPRHWLGVANAIRESYDRYDGFVISHGPTPWPIRRRHSAIWCRAAPSLSC